MKYEYFWPEIIRNTAKLLGVVFVIALVLSVLSGESLGMVFYCLLVIVIMLGLLLG